MFFEDFFFFTHRKRYSIINLTKEGCIYLFLATLDRHIHSFTNILQLSKQHQSCQHISAEPGTEEKNLLPSRAALLKLILLSIMFIVQLSFCIFFGTTQGLQKDLQRFIKEFKAIENSRFYDS